MCFDLYGTLLIFKADHLSTQSHKVVSSSLDGFKQYLTESSRAFWLKQKIIGFLV